MELDWILDRDGVEEFDLPPKGLNRSHWRGPHVENGLFMRNDHIDLALLD